MSAETFGRIVPAFSRLEALILNGIGEPLLHPSLDRFIETARRRMPSGAWVGFQTNGQLLTRTRAVKLVEAGVDKVCISSDAVTPDMFRAMRAGGERAAVDTSVVALRDAARSRGRRVSLGLEFVATRHNIDELPMLYRRVGEIHAAGILRLPGGPVPAFHLERSGVSVVQERGAELRFSLLI